VLGSGLIFVAAGLYLGFLFLLAFLTDRRADRGEQLGFLSSPVIYTLSLAVYCTSWTFYGAVGSAARNGLEFLTIYIGPTLVLMGWWFVLRKLVTIAHQQKITSIADFISARYGKSALLSAMVTLMAVIAIAPYIALQLKAVAGSFDAFSTTESWRPVSLTQDSLLSDTGFWVALCMAVFVILFGTRNLGANERHPGVVVAIAVESTVKLFSLGAIAFFVTFGLYDGVEDLYATAEWNAGVQRLLSFQDGFELRWVALTFLSAAAMICLPRQFHVAVVENADERRLATASWLFPLYVGLISVFVIPIAISGMTALPETANPDLYVLSVPLSAGQDWLALLAFIGGLSAATSMVIVASIALSIMVSNHLVMPVLLRFHLFGTRQGDLTGTLLLVRRLSIVAIVFLGFTYYRVTSSASPLASIGLISFVGVAQFLPALIGGIFWSGGTRVGAACGLFAGFVLWFYTLLMPTLASAGWAFMDIVAQGPFGLAVLKPSALFGFSNWDTLVHGLFWSFSFNLALYVIVSLMTRQSPLEQLQSVMFVNPFDRRGAGMEQAFRRSATTDDLFQLTKRVMGADQAERIFRDYAAMHSVSGHIDENDANLIGHVERQLAGNVGAASARTLVSGIVEGETIGLESVIALLDEKQEIMRYSRELERKSWELQETAEALRLANDQLKELDRMKDDFLSQVSHELRTPMTAIRSFAEILVEAEDVDSADAQRFLGIIHQESMRLTKLLDEVLELGRLEQGVSDLDLKPVDAVAIARRSADTMQGLALGDGVTLIDALGAEPVMVFVDEDRLAQVFVNLLSNAIKFNSSPDPHVWIECVDGAERGFAMIRIRDNGPGIPDDQKDAVFSKFSRGWSESRKRRSGSGLGLPICRQIMEHLGGSLTLTDSAVGGCEFTVRMPLAPGGAAEREPVQKEPTQRGTDAASAAE
jgi:Na+/proline symporter/nitrogen-specific signal transduction histidine kinase